MKKTTALVLGGSIWLVTLALAVFWMMSGTSFQHSDPPQWKLGMTMFVFYGGFLLTLALSARSDMVAAAKEEVLVDEEALV